MSEPTGQQHEITAGAYRAVVTEVGGGLRTLTHDGRDLVVSWPERTPRPLYRGAVLAPWPNRVRDGRYTWAGREEQLALSEPQRGAALHGLLAWTPFEVLDADPAGIVLGARVWPQQGYPHSLSVEVGYRVDASGLQWSVSATNAGSEPAPYGTSIHPYLVAGPGRVDDWTFELDAAVVLDVDAERLLPDRTAPATSSVEGTDLDLRSPRPLAGVAIDHAYTGVGARVARLRAADGSGVEMTWEASCPWVQVHTADRPDPREDRVGLAVEPMTCPPDAFGTGVDLLTLEAGASFTARWGIAAL